MAGNNILDSILKTIIYSDLFNYPLKRNEIWRFLINNKKISNYEIKKYILASPHVIEKKGYICLRKRESIIKKRIFAKTYSVEKYKIAKRASYILSFIPTVLLVGVSGTLAMENVLKDDDIDICIITKKGTLWTTRFLAVFLLDILNMRRKRGMKSVSDKICLNMFIEESILTLSNEKQNLYTAHEIVQMKPIFVRGNAYNKFLKANMWVKKFLPNTTTRIKNKELKIKEEINNSSFVIHYSLFVLEFLTKKVQLWYMKKHSRNKEINDYLLAFYPSNYAEKLLKAYNKRLKGIYEKI